MLKIAENPWTPKKSKVFLLAETVGFEPNIPCLKPPTIPSISKLVSVFA